MTSNDAARWLGPLPAAFTFSQARDLGTPIRFLYALRDPGLIERLSRGLYSRADADAPDLTLLAAATRAPRATLCLRSALARHGLIDDIPATYDLALPRGDAPARARRADQLAPVRPRDLRPRAGTLAAHRADRPGDLHHGALHRRRLPAPEAQGPRARQRGPAQMADQARFPARPALGAGRPLPPSVHAAASLAGGPALRPRWQPPWQPWQSTARSRSSPSPSCWLATASRPRPGTRSDDAGTAALSSGSASRTSSAT